MQLKTITDYAIRALLYLLTENGYVPLHEIADHTCISNASLLKSLRKLRDAGWVDSIGGAEGGYRFIGRAGDISLLDVMRVTEDTIRFNRCLEPDGFCSRNATEYCALHKIYEAYQEQTEKYFSSIHLSDLDAE